jgi:hypothetical protein
VYTSDVIGAKQSMCIKIGYLFLHGRNGRCSFEFCGDEIFFGAGVLGLARFRRVAFDG